MKSSIISPKRKYLKVNKDWAIDKTNENKTALDYGTSCAYLKALLTKYSEHDSEVNKPLCEYLLADLNKMVEYFMTQDKYEYRGMSLYIAVDHNASPDMLISESQSFNKYYVAKLIDIAYVTRLVPDPETGVKRDEGVLTGLQNIRDIVLKISKE